MNFERALAVANAILYEGYALYPYRPSALKNQIRFIFGGLYPRAYVRAQSGADASAFQAECLLVAPSQARLLVRLRFLRVSVPRAGVFQQALEHEVELDLVLGARSLERSERHFCLEPEQRDALRFARLDGALEATVTRLRQEVFRLTVRAENLSESRQLERDAVLPETLAAAHALLGLSGGSFVSSLDPPPELSSAVGSCRNEGVFPVLVGPRPERTQMLASPILLYDYPEVAPESPGDLFDATEIDEILSLRILTLTEEEKQEAARADPRVARLIARTSQLSIGDFERLHGTLRAKASQEVPFRRGDRVRLLPRRRADILDVTLAGRVAIVEAVERDFEGKVQLAVTIEDDPGRDLGVAGFPGHRFFYELGEVERLEEEKAP